MYFLPQTYSRLVIEREISRKLLVMIICLNQVENVKIKGQIVVNMDNKCAKHHTHHGPKKIVKNIVDFVEEVKVQNNFYIRKIFNLECAS